MKFLSDDEKVRFYAAKVGVNMNRFPHREVVKVYEGVDILLYHWEPDNLVVFDTTFRCTGLLLTGQGMMVTLVDRRTYAIYTIIDTPETVGPYDTVVKIPSRCLVERTIRTDDGNREYLEGVTAMVEFYTKSSPSAGFLNHSQVTPLNSARKFFGQKVFDNAVKCIEEAN